jgi:hypothetical protein
VLRVVLSEPLPYGVDRQPEPFLHPDPDEEFAAYVTAVDVLKSYYWYPGNTVITIENGYEVQNYGGAVMAKVTIE